MTIKFSIIFLSSILLGVGCFAQDTFTYPKSSKFEIGKTISPVTPSNAALYEGFSATPHLPHELAIDPSNGTISGVPKEIFVDNNYVIAAKNKKTGKADSVSVSIVTFFNQSVQTGPDPSLAWIMVLCFVLVGFVIFAALRAKRTEKEALGFPSGSIRAIIAILFVIFFTLLSVVFYFDSGTASHSTDLAKQILTILGTLVTAVSAFYFGAKATEQGHTIATDAFKTFQNAAANPVVPVTQTITPATPSGSANNSADMVNQAIQQQGQILKTQFPNIVSILLGSMTSNGHNLFCVDIHLSDNNTANIPTQIPVSYNGSQFSVPVDVIPNVGVAKSNAASGDTIINQTINGMIGTLGCILTDQNKQAFYALSCCHVFTNDKWNTAYSGFIAPTQVIAEKNSGVQIGNWIYGVMNTSFDIAYAAINSAVNITQSGFGSVYDVQPADILNNTPILFNGASTLNGSGFICNNQCTRSIGYGTDIAQINNLILISNSNNTAPSQGGDSGSIVYTADGNKSPIGLLIAADSVFSYLIPIATILSKTGKIIF